MNAGLLAGLAVGILALYLRGGRISDLARVRIRGESIILGLAVLQLVVLRLMDRHASLLGVWVVLQLTIAAMLLLNRGSSGLVVAGVGLAMNGIVVLANGGMPVDAVGIAVRIGGEVALGPDRLDAMHVPLRAGTVAPGLADVLPLVLLDLHRSMVSLGDCFLVVGAAQFISSQNSASASRNFGGEGE